MTLPVSGRTSTSSIPGMRLKAFLISSSCVGSPLAPDTFMRIRPGTWWAILILAFFGRAGTGFLSASGWVASGSPASGMGSFGRFRTGLGGIRLGVNLGDDVVHLLLGLGDHFAGLLS